MEEVKELRINSTKTLTALEMNDLLKEVKKRSVIIYNVKPGFGVPTGVCRRLITWIEVKKISITVTTFKDGKSQQFKTRLDTEDTILDNAKGSEVYRTMQRYYKVPKIKEITPASASPLLYKNDKYEGKRVKAFGYDLNSAYASVLIKDGFPDTSKLLAPGIVKKDEIGFDIDLTHISRTGEFAIFRYKTMPSPYKKFVERWYEKKKNPKNKAQKQRAKDFLNYGIGFWQLINPILRAYVILSCNDYIKSLMDENTIYCNTDSLVSLTKREDLELGIEIGQWKFENEGDFAYSGFNCQWGLTAPKYRGVSKYWFKEGWDILKDELPTFGNIWKYNEKTNRLEKIYGKEKD